MAERFSGQVVCLGLQGMNGPDDARLLELALGAVSGVQGVLIDPDNHLVTLYTSSELDSSAIVQAVSVLGMATTTAMYLSSPVAGVLRKC